MTTAPLTLIGSSTCMRRVRETLGKLARLPWPVRIEGPTGTGKTAAAKILHELSPRAAGPFTPCAVNMLRKSLGVGELVGYVRGAFTGALDHVGFFEVAHGGTLFLDEIGTAVGAIQLALLSLLESGEFRRIGDHRVRRVDVRLVFATNANLGDLVRLGRFREDLFFRLGYFTLVMPALRDHPEDIPEIAEHVLAGYADDLHGTLRPLYTRELAALQAYDWPGNVRELQNALQHFAAFEELPDALRGAQPDPPWRSRLDETLVQCNGVKTATARVLGVSRKTVHEELKRRRESDVVSSVSVGR